MFDCKMQNDTVGIAFFKEQENLNSGFSEGFIWLNIDIYNGGIGVYYKKDIFDRD